MIYRSIGIMSGSSLDGLDIVFAELQEQSGIWVYVIKGTTCIVYNNNWEQKLRNAAALNARDYLVLHTEYGKFIGQRINDFIDEKEIHHQVNLISSHGHTIFHFPENKMSHQLGEGAAIAAETRLPVITDLRSMDIAFGGQGAPIVPLGEKLLFNNYNYFLNIGGIANISIINEKELIAFDVCAANRILNMLALEKGLPYDDKGKIAAQGKIHDRLLKNLNELNYYKLPFPKSLDNSFGINIIYPLLKSFWINIEDFLCTYAEHICLQIKNALRPFKQNKIQNLFVTGGGAFNTFLIERLKKNLNEINFEIFIPDEEIVKYKEALIMALLGTLRWREQYTTMAAVTGAMRNSIGGALWLGNEA